MNPFERSSFQAAVNRDLQQHMDAGAILKAGQFGSTVIQYPDYYLEGSGLAWARNPGQWNPWPTFDGDAPTEPGRHGEVRYASDGSKMMAYIGGKWITIAARSEERSVDSP